MVETIFLAAGVITLLVSGIGFSLAWLIHGRDPRVGPITEAIETPPDDLPPGLVGALVDEHVQFQDVLATLLDLASRNVVRIHETGRDQGVAGIGGGYTHELEMVDPRKPLRPYEDTVLFAIFGQSGYGRTQGQKVPLGPEQLISHREAKAIASAYYEELIERQLMAESPQSTRRRWYVIAAMFMSIVVVGLVVMSFAVDYAPDELRSVVAAAVAAMAVLSIVYGWMVAFLMPAKTRQGAEASARWKAFRRFLKGIDERDSLTRSQEVFERYLPYAVAFRLEHSYVHTFSVAGRTMPAWFGGGSDSFLDMHYTASRLFTSRTTGGRTFAE